MNYKDTKYCHNINPWHYKANIYIKDIGPISYIWGWENDDDIVTFLYKELVKD